MTQCPDTIKRLIDRFDHQSDTIRSPDCNQTLIALMRLAKPRSVIAVRRRARFVFSA